MENRNNQRSHHPVWTVAVTALAIVAVLMFPVALGAQGSHTSSVFSGAKVNHGTVTHTKMGGKNVLTLSADFEYPGTPDPHWQIVDSRGKVHLVQRLELKDGKMNMSITLPEYIPDVAKVQIWCAWAEVVLGEASFARPVG